MALSSPGVEVNVIDESFYTPAAGATVPLIVVATAESKPNGSGTGTAAGTLKANAGKVYLITSQRELTDTFGNPTFYTDASNNPLHGNELNEYGLQAAYSYLGVANRAYVVRADANLGELSGSADAPAGPASDGTYWFDTDDSNYGIFVWEKSPQKFTNVTPKIISSASDLDGVSGSTYTGVKSSVGAVGDYAVVTWNTENKLFYKNSNNVWVQVGSQDEAYFDSTGFDTASTWTSTTWSASWPTVTATKSPASLANGGALIINGQTVTNSGATVTTLAQSINAKGILGIGAKVTSTGRLEIYTDGTSKADGSTADGGILIQIPRDAGGNATSTYVGPNTTDTGDLGIIEGYYAGPALQISAHSKVPQWKSQDTVDIGASTYSAVRPNGSVWVKSTDPNLGANWILKLYSSSTGLWSTVSAPIYSTSAEAIKSMDATGGTKLATGTLFIKSNATGKTPALADFKIYRRVTPAPTSATGNVENPTFISGATFQVSESLAGDANMRTARTVTVNGTNAEAMVSAISGAGFVNVEAEVTATGAVKISHKLGGEMIMTEGLNNPLTAAGFVTTKPDNVYAAPANSGATIVMSNWKPLVYEAKAGAPTSTPADGTLWYSTTLDEVDMLVHDGAVWRGYKNVYPDSEIQVSATQPTKQTDGTDLARGDIWIDSSNTETYGSLIYKWDFNNQEWFAVDVADQTTEDGVLFADARFGYTGATGDTASNITLYGTSDYVDPDAPDPDLYPRGMLLWNTRRSGYNVKKFVKGHVDINENNGRNKRFQGLGTVYTVGSTDESMASYKVDRWVGWNTTAEDGSGLFGRKAQRKTVVAALKSEVDTNQDLRDEETRTFTLLSAPGYVELASNLVNLNVDRGITGFVVADTPFRLGSSASELLAYGNNSNNALADGEKGLVTYDEYMGAFYPSGFTTDVNGNNIVVPPSYMMMRTIALSDAVSYPWFAPAGTRRGGITNASSVGYIDAEGEFKAVALNEGVRDTMAQVKINPLTYITGSGLVNFGQFTRARNASALDRINVARLVAYLRRQLTLLAKPFMFEPNDKITRDEIKQAAESLLLELVGQRALYDFLVVCDESNNTPARIDRSELYLDIAIEPVKAVEFIYIPLRLKNTGEIATLGAQ